MTLGGRSPSLAVARGLATKYPKTETGIGGRKLNKYPRGEINIHRRIFGEAAEQKVNADKNSKGRVMSVLGCALAKGYQVSQLLQG